MHSMFVMCLCELFSILMCCLVVKSPSPLLSEKETFLSQQEYSMCVYIHMHGKATQVCCENQDRKCLIYICRQTCINTYIFATI